MELLKALRPIKKIPQLLPTEVQMLASKLRGWRQMHSGESSKHVVSMHYVFAHEHTSFCAQSAVFLLTCDY